MPRLRKLRRKQKYRYNVNRKRLNAKLTKMPEIQCDAVKKAWDSSKSLTENVTQMGLVLDPNNMKGLAIPKRKDLLRKLQLDKKNNKLSTSPDLLEPEPPLTKGHVAIQLEKQARDGYAAKKTNPHPLPKEMLRKLTTLLDKYGENFKAMANDHTNYNQETPAQLQSQVKRLKAIPQQWIPYLKSRNLLEKEGDQLQEPMSDDIDDE